ncbi:TPA: hypothetical protein ACSP1Y_002561 [Aeromonas hydrophila]|jgi:hypothetical protein
MVMNEQRIHSLILKELERVCCKKEAISHISSGSEIYGNNGILDSSSLVQFIAGLSEWLEENTRDNIDFFALMDDQFLSHFRDIYSLSNYLSGHIGNASI